VVLLDKTLYLGISLCAHLAEFTSDLSLILLT
jgi:hypothetical protein